MNFFRKNNNNVDIVPWDPGYYPEIYEANPDQQKCYLRIKEKIETGTFVDVEGYDSYLYYYTREIAREITASVVNGYMASSSRKCKNFLDLYSEVKPKVCSYADYWLFVARFFERKPFDEVLETVDKHIEFREKNGFQYATDLTLAMYASLKNIKASDYVDPSKYLSAFCGVNLNSFMTQIGRKYKRSILKYCYQILDDDYESNHINFLFRLYDFVPGGLSMDGESISIETEENLESSSSIIKVSGFKVPVRKNVEAETLLKNLVREAEDIFRDEKGLKRVGEGWVSETLLFRRVEAAFPNIKVLQHSSPSFLGRQHYDVYLPEYKIALEYQGDQHFSPVDFFGGEKGLENARQRDEKKKLISKQNGVVLIEVMPKYEIDELIGILYERISRTSPDKLSDLERARQMARDINNTQKIEQKNDFSDSMASISKKIKAEQVLEKELDERTQQLVKQRPKSKFAEMDFTKLEKDEMLAMLEEFSIIEKLSKTNPTLSNKLLYELMDRGYNAPAAYLRLAINYRKLKQPKSELTVLVQGKKDFGYNFDERIKKVIRKLDDSYL